MKIARPDVAAGQRERKPNMSYVLQMESGETIQLMKEAFVLLTLGWQAFRIWVFVSDIRDEFILGLDVLRAYDASVDLGRHLLLLGQKEVTLFNTVALPT
jgi:hypothetical protein